jgi:hypothetical protein
VGPAHCAVVVRFGAVDDTQEEVGPREFEARAWCGEVWVDMAENGMVHEGLRDRCEAWAMLAVIGCDVSAVGWPIPIICFGD